MVDYIVSPLYNTWVFWDKLFNKFPNINICFYSMSLEFDRKILKQIIKNQHKYDLIVIDASSEYLSYNNTQYSLFSNFVQKQDIKKLVDSVNIPVIVFTPEPDIKSDNINLAFLPLFYFDVWHLNTKPVALKEKTYKLSCLNRMPRVTRIHILSHLKHKHYFNSSNFLFTFKNVHYNKDMPENKKLEYGSIIWKPLQLFVTPETLEKVKKDLADIFPTLPIIFDNPNHNDHSIYHPAYANSVCNLITETCPVGFPFLTEKTFKCLAQGIPFFIHNAQGSLNQLKRWGFDIYDDILDQSYDSISDYEHRTDSLISSVDKFMDSDIQFDYDRQQKNIDYFFSQDTYDMFFNKAVKDIENVLSL